jgi:tetratricopeptide (TPR) repeat protein
MLIGAAIAVLIVASGWLAYRRTGRAIEARWIGHIIRGGRQFDQGHLGAAEKHFLKALLLASRLPSRSGSLATTAYNLGLLCHKAGRYAESEEHLVAATTLPQYSEDVRQGRLIGLARLYLDWNRFDSAESILRRVVKFDAQWDQAEISGSDDNLELLAKVLRIQKKNECANLIEQELAKRKVAKEAFNQSLVDLHGPRVQQRG